MTPDEAKQTLLDAGIFSKWEGRRLIGGSTYKPGNPGVFEGIRFTIILIEPGVYTAVVTDFADETRELQVRSLAGGDRKDLEWAVRSVLDEMQTRLDRLSFDGPKVPLATAIELCQAFPTATTEAELLSQLIFTNDSVPEWSEQAKRDAIARFGSAPRPAGPGLTEEQRMVSDVCTHEETMKWSPPIVGNPDQKPVTGYSKNIVPYGASDAARTAKALQRYRRSYHWAPLETKDSWPSVLRPVPPFSNLSIPRELTLIFFMSAVRQLLEEIPEWFELIAFSTEPVDGKVTACFLATRADPPRTKKPQWLLDLASPAEKEVHELEERLAKGSTPRG